MEYVIILVYFIPRYNHFKCLVIVNFIFLCKLYIINIWKKNKKILTNLKENNNNNNNNNSNNNSNNPVVLKYRVGVRWKIAVSHGQVGVFSLGWQLS